ncbi:nitric oxide synthase oxygenase [Kitasatospora sp. CM 4170]|uniref:Nitric oxide synthase oxygenase n=1 Tax=Kitasatospora aburaviensis TaxID=67265 RepID=A0ABW1EQ02_9ACTN|nr:nitric oxide synthase oxygenase [Kitasatospora sp. CM 4170]WNM48705.1 nitric oxide synthase oxygenase [Kitasatospora sp. CM 4170]
MSLIFNRLRTRGTHSSRRPASAPAAAPASAPAVGCPYAHAHPATDATGPARAGAPRPDARPGPTAGPTPGPRPGPLPAVRQPTGHGTGRLTPHPAEPFTDPGEAAAFVRQFHHEQPAAGDPAERLRAVLDEIDRTGTYEHTPAELAYGAKLAWRNAARCIGRLYWRSLVVRDLRHLGSADDIAAECFEHLRTATNGGRIRPVVSVFAPDRPGRPAARILNQQLVRYAGHPAADGGWTGDPAGARLAARARDLGWKCGEERFEVLPLLVQERPGERPEWYGLPEDTTLEVELTHPDHDWFAELGLRWYAVPAISDMTLEIGGVRYPTAPFNGWYMGTEIGARNLADADRYDMLATVAGRLGLDTSSDRTLWRDRALVELNVAVLHSFQEAGVTIADHHTESVRFLKHVAQEQRLGRPTPADWSWIVPPVSGGLTPVYHRYYDPVDPALRPAFTAREPW